MLRNAKALSTSTALWVRGGNHGNNIIQGYSGLLIGLARITLKALPPFGTQNFRGASATDHSDHFSSSLQMRMENPLKREQLKLYTLLIFL